MKQCKCTLYNIHVLADQAFTNVFVSCMKLALHTEMDVSIKEIPGRTLLFFIIHLQQIPS